RLVQGRVAGLDRLHPDGDNQVGLPDTGLADDQPAPVLFDKTSGGQIEDLLTIDGRVKGKIKIFQRLAFRKVSLAQTTFQQTIAPAIDLVLDQQLKELLMREPALNGLLQSYVKDLGHAGKPQMTKFSFQFG